MGAHLTMARLLTSIILIAASVMAMILLFGVACSRSDFSDFLVEAVPDSPEEDFTENLKGSKTSPKDFTQSSFVCNSIALKGSKNRYLSAHPSGRIVGVQPSGKLHLFLRGRAQEKFKVIDCPGGTVCFKSQAYNKYIMATPNGKLTLTPHPRAWGRFRIAKIGHKLTIKSSHSKYLSAQPDGSGLLSCNRPIARATEHLHINVGESIAHGQ